MALDISAFAQPHLGLMSLGVMSRIGLSGRDFPLGAQAGPRFSTNDDLAVAVAASPVAEPAEARSPFEPVSLTSTLDAQRRPFGALPSGSWQSGTLGEIRERENRVAPEGMRTVYSPRGTPADAVPAMTRLEARIAFEPVYMHHYASMRYEFVSRMAYTPSERRQQFNLLV